MRGFLRETDQFFAEYMPPVTKWFFYINVLVFMLSFLMLQVLQLGPVFDRLFVLTPAQAVLQGHLWQFVAYMVTQYDFWHLFLNMIVLFFFGGLVERHIGGRPYFWLLMASGVLAGVAHTILAFATGNPGIGLVGFSGAGFAILTAAVIYFPHARVLFMLVIPMPMRVFAVIIGVFMSMSILADFQQHGLMGGGVSHTAHLVGIAVGIVLVKFPVFLYMLEGFRIPFLMRPQPKAIRGGRGRVGMGHPGRHSDPDDRYDDPHWRLDQ